MLKIIAKKNLLTDGSVKEKIVEKLDALEKLVSRIGEPNEMRVHLEKTSYFEPKGSAFRCKINVRLPGKVLRAEAEKTDIIAAATEAKAIMERLLKQYKKKYSQVVKTDMRSVKKKIKESAQD